MWAACSLLRPGRTSTSTSLRTSSGATPARAIDVRPPSDIPTTPWASGARARTTSATSRALSVGEGISEEHTSELQVTNAHLVCRLLLEKKKKEHEKRKTKNKI